MPLACARRWSNLSHGFSRMKSDRVSVSQALAVYYVKVLKNRGSAMGRSKVLFAALFLFLTVSVVNAYTVVMRDGRRVEIPNQFAVTNSTVTYDVDNGIQVTIQLNTVDTGATERANGEAQGAFLRKATAPQVPVESVPQTRATSAQRSQRT